MKISVSKKVKLAATEDAIYLENMQHHPHKKILAETHHSGVNMQLKRCLTKILKMELAKI
jgi:hypothetical protein